MSKFFLIVICVVTTAMLFIGFRAGQESRQEVKPHTVDERLDSHLHTLNGHRNMMRNIDRRLDEIETLQGRIDRVEDAVVELRESTKKG